jgi:hypothetical protein
MKDAQMTAEGREGWRGGYQRIRVDFLKSYREAPSYLPLKITIEKLCGEFDKRMALMSSLVLGGAAVNFEARSGWDI